MATPDRERMLLGLALILLAEEMEQDGVKRAGYKFVLDGALKKRKVTRAEVEEYLLDHRREVVEHWQRSMKK